MSMQVKFKGLQIHVHVPEKLFLKENISFVFIQVVTPDNAKESHTIPFAIDIVPPLTY